MPLRNQRAASLVITLCFLVIISVVVVAFLSQAALNRQLSFSSAGQIRAQILGESVSQIIIDDLRDEIRAGSTNLSSGTNSLFFPLTNAVAVPFRTVPEALTNLVKVSRAGQPFWSGTDYAYNGPTRSSQQVPTTAAAGNGRYIKAERWNRPFLLGTNLPPSFVPPDWFLLTRDGPLSTAEPALTVLRDRAPANTNAVIGRYAFAVYDVGGLLDINAAGNQLSATNNALRGRMHQADLSRIPGVIDPAKLVLWRNPVTSTNAAWLNASTNAFLTVTPGDQRFLSRQDLIRYVQQHSDVASPEALQYLTTFSRERNAPTFKPAVVTTANPNIASVLRADGRPMMDRRFSLGNLGKITFDATTEAGSEIERLFGLTRSSANDPWVYNHGSASRIYTLDEVAAQNRDPDFFEVLKAVVLEGSLGKTAGDPAVATSDTAFRSAHIDANLDLQIIRIGANLIDQYDADSWPTAIQFEVAGAATVSSGVENLPYINRMFDTPYRPNLGARDSLSTWYAFEMWNPHQTSVAAAPGPGRFRIITVSGQAYASMVKSTGGTNTNVNGPITTFSPGSRWIEFGPQSFTEPTLLTQANSSCDNPPPDGADLCGLFVGSVNIAGIPESDYGNAGSVPQNFPSFALQYQNANGQWVTYQDWANLLQPNRSGHGGKYFKEVNPNRGYYFRADPRNVRFGGGSNSGNAAGASMRGIDGSLYPFKQNEGKYTANGPIASNPGWTRLRTAPAPTHVRLPALANNDAVASTSYRDPDGQLRIADGGLRGAAENPFEPGNLAARPIVLNRPFRSVGEMSYAFRDEPWKTLNFFSQNSADAGLLDAFTLDDEEKTAAKVNLNTRQPKVIEALVSGTARQENALSQVVSDTEAADIASALVAATKVKPFLNKADLVSLFASDSVGASWPAIKSQREAVVRGLAEAGSVRTWNLLIDFVVQVGRYPLNSQDYANFLVEGERRYWLHLALDRYSGKVIDQQLEAINE